MNEVTSSNDVRFIDAMKDRQTLILSAICLILSIFTIIPYHVALFAWIWPACLLFVMRRLLPKHAVIVCLIILMISSVVSFTPILFDEIGIIAIPACMLLGILISVPFIIDRLLYGKISEIQSWLLFPFITVSLEIILSYMGIGTIFSLSYSQADFLWLLQSMSVMGGYFITFLLYWFASSVYLFIAQYRDLKKIDPKPIICLAVILIVVISGGVRASTEHITGDTVSIYCANGPLTEDYFGPAIVDSHDNISAFDNILNSAVAENSDLLMFTEESFRVQAPDEDAFLGHIVSSSAMSGTYVLVSYQPVDIVTKEYLYNRCAFISPDNGLEWKYDKTYLAPVEETDIKYTGNGSIQHSDTPFGSMSAAICYDIEIPDLIRNAPHDTGLMMVPSWEWSNMGWHVHSAQYRAMENGFTILKNTYRGDICCFDYLGNTKYDVPNYPSVYTEYHVCDVQVSTTDTVYNQYGSFIELMYIILALLCFVPTVYQFIKSKRE